MTIEPAALIHERARMLSAADHAGTIRMFFPFWDIQYRPFLIRAVEALPVEGFDFKPRPEMLTAHQVVVHIAESERGWIHYVVEGGTYEEWVVPHEEPGQGWRTTIDAPDHASLLALLEQWHRPTQEWLDRPVAEIARVVSRRRADGSEQRFTLHWILDRLQEHEIHHRAQLNLYLRMMGIEPPGT